MTEPKPYTRKEVENLPNGTRVLFKFTDYTSSEEKSVWVIKDQWSAFLSLISPEGNREIALDLKFYGQQMFGWLLWPYASDTETDIVRRIQV